MQQILREIDGLGESLIKIILSAPVKKDSSPKIVLRALEQKGKRCWGAERMRDNKAYHTTLSPTALPSYLEEAIPQYRQIGLFCEEKEISFRISKKGKLSRSVNAKAKSAPTTLSHNREKHYLIREGQAIPFLIDLGIMTREGKIVSSMQDKFRQINRFIELVDHAFRDYEKEEISVLDFGCGKSYLTFLIYYYFAVLKKKRVLITGYDLKQDVVANCNELAKKYGYHGLSFVVADVTRDTLSDRPIDFVISLHACDVATDFALHFALERGVPYIFSVPCCQHEINAKITPGGGDLDPFLSHGIYKERMSALLTDVIRTQILEAKGYRVDVLEFVDFAHSPKNLMLRAKKKAHYKEKSLDEIGLMEQRYGFTQTLYHLQKGDLS